MSVIRVERGPQATPEVTMNNPSADETTQSVHLLRGLHSEDDTVRIVTRRGINLNLIIGKDVSERSVCFRTDSLLKQLAPIGSVSKELAGSVRFRFESWMGSERIPLARFLQKKCWLCLGSWSVSF